MHRSPATLQHSAVSIKSWLDQTPTVDAVRPSHCPRCQVASRPPGLPLRLLGHGLIPRHLRTVGDDGGRARVVTLSLRRFLCLVCGHACTVAPADLIVRRLFCRTALVLALTLWAVLARPAGEVRAALSAQVTFDGDHWPQLARWSRRAAAGHLFGGSVRAAPSQPRALAAAVVTQLRALAPAFLHGQGPAAEALAGAARLR